MRLVLFAVTCFFVFLATFVHAEEVLPRDACKVWQEHNANFASSLGPNGVMIIMKCPIPVEPTLAVEMAVRYLEFKNLPQRSVVALAGDGQLDEASMKWVIVLVPEGEE